jgi:acetyl/propionyl-CoA carboxylase alpha subunit/acetyl-CoA carboxylase carboxyltransferase component
VSEPLHRFSRIAVVNRGEAAMRVIHAVRELGREQGRDLRTIALHTRAEERAMFVRAADEAVCLDPDGPTATGSPYLDLTILERALRDARADAAWVGWGFVAERPEFAELCERIGVVFIGPSGAVMRLLGDKIGAKLLAEQSEVPVARWSGGPVETLEDAQRHADEIGYPLMIKATSGGGGRGIRKVTRPDELAVAFESARTEGLKSFGDPTVFLERVVEDAHHVEVQIIADSHGTAWALGVRDCTLQRRNQKVIEESRSTALTDEQDLELRDAAVRLTQAAGYVNAGTVEFLYQPREQTFAFLEVNTRLQVEHPITELTTGVDIVKLQLHVAAGGRLVDTQPDGHAPAAFGHAIEARLNAEDPQRGFAPAPGRITLLSFPVGPGIRVDTGVAEGDLIPPEYDSMIAKVIAWGRDRDEALSRLWRAVADTTVIIDGGTTNKAFLLELLDRREVREGDIDTGWLDRVTATDEFMSSRFRDIALMMAAIDAADGAEQDERERFFEWARRGRPHAGNDVGHEIELRNRGTSASVWVGRTGRGTYRLVLDGRAVTVAVDRLGRAHSRLIIGDQRFSVVSSTQRGDHLVEVGGVAHRFSRDDGGVVRASAAALVVGVHVAVGDIVEVGTPIVVVEAMKMEINIAAPTRGRVRDVFVARNVQVDAGAPLLRIEPIEPAAGDDSEAAAAQGETIDFAAWTAADSDAAAGAEQRSRAQLDTLRATVLGFDIDAITARRVLERYRQARAGNEADLPIDVDRSDHAELEILDAFVHLGALTRDLANEDGEAPEATSPREHFNTYLRSLDIEREGLPSRFRARLLDALAHFGIDDLEPSDALEDAVYRIFLAYQRRAALAPTIVGLLERQLADGREPGQWPPELRDTLDRLIDSTRRSDPAIANLARSVRHRHLDQPLVDEASRRVRQDMERHLARLEEDAGAARDEAVQALIACPQPLLPIIASGGALADSIAPAPLLDVLTRRYYKIRELAETRYEEVDGAQVVRTAYVHRGRVVHVVVVRFGRDELGQATDVITRVASTVPVGETMVVDLYLMESEGDGGVDSLAAQVGDHLASAGVPANVTRIALIACRTEPEVVIQYLTFRRSDVTGERPFWMLDGAVTRRDAFAEDVKFRGLHPMIARRLRMWRLADFEITRLPSEEDVHLFECVARNNPADVRLVAVAEVRDLTPVTDADGNVTALPEVEHVLDACLEGIRRAEPGRSQRSNLDLNRIALYVWPVAELSVDDLNRVARRLAPLTEGLGIEQVVVEGRFADAASGRIDEVELRLAYEPGHGVTAQFRTPPNEPIQTLDEYSQKVLQARRRGLQHPYELVPLLAGPGGTFVEHDLLEDGSFAPIDRPRGANRAGIVAGVVTSFTKDHPDGMVRVALFGDPTRAMGSIAEPECRMLLAAIDLAERLAVPIDWFALSAGAKIAMDSGSENLDWVARVLRRLVEHTQRGFEVNVVVAGINVGAQPYWNAEATMLMHTKGILVMTPDSAMVLTGKQAIDYSGGVSAENNLGIGGYQRIMGPNGEAQYWAPDLAAACAIVNAHHDLCYVVAGEDGPRRLGTKDPLDRDVRSAPHSADGSDFKTVGEIFSAETNVDRKKPFDIRALMDAIIDSDRSPLERWRGMAEAETAVVYDARLGGCSVTMIGIESRPLPRHGETPADGPNQWSAGTLFPLSSKKVARAINAASGNRPVVVLANLSGFDGSPESLRRLQLEYGAEIGRAIVNFAGPIVLCVVSRYHGGAFVVFSGTLNDRMEVLAVEGSFASVIGGAPAAAVVFTGDVNARTRGDERVVALQRAVADASADDQGRLIVELAEVTETVRIEKLGQVAAEFDAVHSIDRALAVGSVHRIITAEALRPALIEAVIRGIGATDVTAVAGRNGARVDAPG